jgi:hypothetical protein
MVYRIFFGIELKARGGDVVLSIAPKIPQPYEGTMHLHGLQVWGCELHVEVYGYGKSVREATLNGAPLALPIELLVSDMCAAAAGGGGGGGAVVDETRSWLEEEPPPPLPHKTILHVVVNMHNDEFTSTSSFNLVSNAFHLPTVTGVALDAAQGVVTWDPLSTNACSGGVPPDTRRDCHPEPNAAEQTCVARQCCWQPSNDGGVPWCFHPAGLCPNPSPSPSPRPPAVTLVSLSLSP